MFEQHQKRGLPFVSEIVIGLKTSRQKRLYLYDTYASLQNLYLLCSSFHSAVFHKLIYKLCGLQSFSFLECISSVMHTYTAFYEIQNMAW